MIVEPDTAGAQGATNGAQGAMLLDSRGFTRPPRFDGRRDLPSDVMWRLRKQLPGRRTAGQRWLDHAAALLTDELGMIRCVECPCFFQSLNGVVIELHMDDFHGAGQL